MNRNISIAAVFVALVACAPGLGQSPQPAPPSIADGRRAQEDFEAALNRIPTPASLSAYHDLLGSEPHIAGSPGDHRNIQRIAAEFERLGLEVQVHEFWPFLATPLEASLQIVSPQTLDLPLKEQALAEDSFSGDPELHIGFNAYSGSGDVTAEIVYANFGTKADFEKLKELGVDCAGKIVIARYGGNFRGYKAKFAQQAGAIGLIIYTDPDDNGYRKGLPYPEGGWGNDTYIQRGSILTLDYPGDPLTPGTPATEKAQRLNPDAIDLPRIPVQPIGYGAAREIMIRMKGAPLPEEMVKTWQGGLPCAYRLQGGPELRVRLMVKQNRAIVKTANVLGTLRGSRFPDQKVIIGCHHDAWCHGAGDPLAGTILVMEAAKSFAQLARDGHRPARSIVFATWGAEEYGIIGSTEYCEQFADELTQSAVAYINLDAAAMGPNFSASASPSLKRIIDEIITRVPQARNSSGQTVHQAWLGDKKELGFNNLGGGSDHVGFYCHLGIPSCGLNAGGAPGSAYHSNYDNLAWYRKTVGEDYEPALMLARAVNLLAARLACAPLLPLDPLRYAADSRTHLQTLSDLAAQRKFNHDFASTMASIEQYQKRAQRVCERLDAAMQSGALDDDSLANINSILLTMERCWLTPNDAPATRAWFRNQFAASDPDSGYASWMLPRLRLAIERNDAAALQLAEKQLADVFARLTLAISGIEGSLEPVNAEVAP